VGTELVGIRLHEVPCAGGACAAFLPIGSQSTLLIGRNSSGKTRTLQSIERALGAGHGPRGSSGPPADTYVRLTGMCFETNPSGWRWFGLHLHAQAEVNRPAESVADSSFAQLLDLEYEPQVSEWLDRVEAGLLDSVCEEGPHIEWSPPPAQLDAFSRYAGLVDQGVGHVEASRRAQDEVSAREESWTPPQVVRTARQSDVRCLVEEVFSEPVVRLPHAAHGDFHLAVLPYEMTTAARDAAERILEWCEPSALRIVAEAARSSEHVVDLFNIGEDATGDLPENEYEVASVHNPVLRPIVISLHVALSEADRLVSEHLASTARGSGWLVAVPGVEGRYEVPQVMTERIRSISERCQALTPGFLRREGEIQFRLREPTQWSAGLSPIEAGFKFRSTGEFVQHELVGSGMARWIALIAALTCALDQAARPGHGLVVEPKVVLLVDEPELHLHPSAQRNVGEWLEAISSTREGLSAIVATHSPEILAARKSGSSVVAVRGRDAPVPLQTITPDVLLALDELSTDLGLSSSSWLYAVRGVLLVEGQHDLEVIRQFFGRELAERQVLTLALRGSDNAVTVVESNLFVSLGVPVRILLDNVTDEVVKDLRGGRKPGIVLDTSEKKLAEHIFRRMSAGGDFDVIPLDEPDVVCCLPEAAVKRAFPSANFSEWKLLTDVWHNMSVRQSFKRAVAPLMQVSLDFAFVEAVLAACSDDDAPSDSLVLSIEAALASYD